MKNKICYFILLLIISGKIHGQVYDTIFVYDTIVVYDTIIVYDTIKTVHNAEHAVKQAILEFDTSNQKALLKIINEKDTATIPVNSIIVSETYKNSQTMKKLNLTLAASALLTQMLSAQSAQESKTATDVPEKKYALGIGVCYNAGAGFGGALKFDRLKTKKLSFGVRSHITSNKWTDWAYPADATDSNSIGYTAKFRAGHVINGFLTTTYYLLGNNSSSKAGLYLSGGLGYQHWTMSETVAYTNNLSNYDHDSKFSYHNFLAMGCVGGDYRIGPGKLFFDIPFLFNILERYHDKNVYKNGDTSFNDDPWDNGHFALDYGAINIGYALSF